jgi:histidine triad (HIT) family protein
MSAACVFCQIVSGEAPSEVVHQDDLLVAFLDHRPLLRGHVLVVPRAHVETFHDLAAGLVAPLFAEVQRLSRAVERGLAADGAFVAINTRISQSVPHLHVHVVPRWRGDGLFSPKLLWRRQPYRSEAERRATADAIGQARRALADRAGS